MAEKSKTVPKEHHGRDYIIACLGALAEYLALRYGMNWLAWLAAFLLWLAVVEYTRRWASVRGWIYAMWIGLFVTMGIATYYLTRQKPTPEIANTSAASSTTDRVSSVASTEQGNKTEQSTKKSIKQKHAVSAYRQNAVPPLVQRPMPSSTASTVVNAPGGIPIVGNTGVVDHPTVNNYAPPPPQVKWKPIYDYPIPQTAKHPCAFAQMSLDRALIDAKFAVICDRPCSAVANSNSSELNAMDYATTPGRPNVAVFVARQPNPFPSRTDLVLGVQSDDDVPPKIINVVLFFEN